MSQIDTEEVMSGDIEGAGEGEGTRLVPVTESIRYRKRAQGAEKKAEAFAEQLAAANQRIAEMSEQMSSLQFEHKLARKLASAGVVDLEAAVLVAKARMQGKAEADVDGCVEQLKKEKQYLFTGVGPTPTVGSVSKKTAGARNRVTPTQTLLDKAATRAARTGSRADLQEYLRLRRNLL
jgi:uncharacterized protein YhaN